MSDLKQDWKQELFNYMSRAHNLTLTETEMNDIRAVIYEPVIDDHQAIVSKDQLQRWLSKIEDAKVFRVDAEADIGWVVESFKKLTINGLNFKMLGKLAMGKLDAKEIGLDVDRLEAIGRKYAPETFKRIEQQTQDTHPK